jgi:hypothetical protein
VTMESKVDPNIIGGFVVEMNNELWCQHSSRFAAHQETVVENMYVSKIIAS